MFWFERLEAYLESNGWLKVLSCLRTFEGMFVGGSHEYDWLRAKITLDWKGGAIAQRETYLKEEIAAWESGSAATVADRSC